MAPNENPVPRDEKAEKPVEYKDPEAGIDAEHLRAMKQEIAARPEKSLEQTLYEYQDIFYRMLQSYHPFLNSIGYTEEQTRLVNDLNRLIGDEMNAKRKEVAGKSVTNFKEFWAPVLKGERLFAALEQTLVDRGYARYLNRYQDQMRNGGLKEMLTKGVKAEGMKGKEAGIQSFVIPEHVEVEAVPPADFMVLASEKDYTGPEATAYNKFARKAPQYMKQIHLKVPEGTVPTLKFEWTDATTNCKMVSTVTGEKDAEGRWQFFPAKSATLQEGQQVAPPAPQRRGILRRW